VIDEFDAEIKGFDAGRLRPAVESSLSRRRALSRRFRISSTVDGGDASNACAVSRLRT
jgi:hypothetical protein